MENNEVKNPNWLEANQLAVYSMTEEIDWGLLRANPDSSQRRTLECRSSTLTVRSHSLVKVNCKPFPHHHSTFLKTQKKKKKQ